MIRSIFALTVITLSVLFAVFYVKPLYDRTEGRTKDIDTINFATRNTQELYNLINTASTTMDAFMRTSNDERLKVFLPEAIDPLRLANNIKYIGLRSNLALSDIKVEEKAGTSVSKSVESGTAGALRGATSLPRPTSSQEEGDGTQGDTKGYVATKASFSVVATYPVFQGLLSDIENSLGLMNITALSFQEYSDGNKAKDSKSVSNMPLYYKYTVELETYSLR